jgi:hypothetical protein
MTDPTLDLDAIEKRAAAATPGPWAVQARRYSHGAAVHEPWLVYGGPDGMFVCDTGKGQGACRLDAEFIAASVTDVPALVAECRRLRAQRDAALARLDAAVVENDSMAAEATATDADSLHATRTRSQASAMRYARSIVRAALGVQPEGN